MGSNLGNRCECLQKARERILELSEVWEPVLSSSLYETEPVECEPGAKNFLNAVLEVEVERDPVGLLRDLKAIEVLLGRETDHARNRSRPLDLDLLYVDDRVSDGPELELPHPRMLTRRFVLVPLAEIRSELILPGQTESVSTLLGRLTDKSAVVRIAREW